MMDEETVIQVCALLSTTVLALSFVKVIPQLYEVIVSDSSENVSIENVAMDLVSASVMIAYLFATDNPLDTYFENIPFAFQDAVLAVIILKNRDQLNLEVIVYFVAYVCVCVVVAMNLLPDMAMTAALITSLFALNAGKAIQLHTIVKDENAGRVSALGWAIYVYITAARIVTTVACSMDMILLIALFANAVLNPAVLVSILYYGNSPEPRRR